MQAVRSTEHVWTHDGPDSETFGLEPNYGCCTANFNQGWPKLAHNMIFTESSPPGVVVGIWAPQIAVTSKTSSVTVETEYPFGDDATVTVANTGITDLAVKLRIPSWSTAATVNGAAAANGTLWAGTAPASMTTTFKLEFNPEVRLQRWDGGAVSVHRGALMYSLPISANFTTYGHHFGDDGNDYELSATAEWRFALDEGSLVFRRNAPLGGAAPWNHTGWPVVIDATVREVPSWGMTLNSASEPPASPACTAAGSSCGGPVKVTLVPHGGTDLRVGELPVSGL